MVVKLYHQRFWVIMKELRYSGLLQANFSLKMICYYDIIFTYGRVYQSLESFGLTQSQYEIYLYNSNWGLLLEVRKSIHRLFHKIMDHFIL